MEQATLRRVIESHKFEYFWFWKEGKWEIGYYRKEGNFGIFESMHEDGLDYLEYAEMPAIGLPEPSKP